MLLSVHFTVIHYYYYFFFGIAQIGGILTLSQFGVEEMKRGLKRRRIRLLLITNKNYPEGED